MSQTMRESWVDYAKGIDILLVVFGHVNRGLQAAGIIMPSKLYHLVDSIIYSFHMPLFFFCLACFLLSRLRRKESCFFSLINLKRLLILI